ncbi:MAG: transcription antitermination factor NusB [Acidimicrobiales bacterium]
MTSARLLALDALDRIERDGAYANLLLPELLQRSELEPRDRHFVTELVYGTTRMKRACDFLVDRFVARPLDLRVRNALRLGAYQLQVLQMPPHAAVGETVEVAPKRARGLVNAVLRRVADSDVTWPDVATRLSYPDWIVDRLHQDLGEAALGVLEHMNRPPAVTERPDGYVQDLASQWVAGAVEARAGERVADLCAAPGGKATLMAASGAVVVACDVRAGRAGLIRQNAPSLPLLVTDAAMPALRPRSFDRVLLDAPCSGLGALRRRPDARWRVDPEAPERLAELQRRMLDAAAALVAPGGVLVYSVCTLTAAEGPDVAQHLLDGRHDILEVLPPPPGPPWSRPSTVDAVGHQVLPDVSDTDGMYLARFRLG